MLMLISQWQRLEYVNFYSHTCVLALEKLLKRQWKFYHDASVLIFVYRCFQSCGYVLKPHHPSVKFGFHIQR